MQFMSLKGLELLFVGSRFKFETKQLLEHQIENIHHATCDFRNKNQHFHSTKIERISMPTTLTQKFIKFVSCK